MGAGIHFLTVMGGMMVVIGLPMALWPADITALTQDEDGKPIPPAPANVRWTRVLGVALVVAGVLLIWAGLAGVQGADDPVLV